MTKREQYIKLRAKGMTFQAIADKYGVTRQAVQGAVNYKKKTQPRPKLK
jgi:uncharacterized protein (DUF433 family)